MHGLAGQYRRAPGRGLAARLWRARAFGRRAWRPPAARRRDCTWSCCAKLFRGGGFRRRCLAPWFIFSRPYMINNDRLLVQILLLVLFGASLWVMAPFWSALLFWGAVLAFASWPLMRLLTRWVNGRESLAAALLTVGWMLLVAVPLVWLEFQPGRRMYGRCHRIHQGPARGRRPARSPDLVGRCTAGGRTAGRHLEQHRPAGGRAGWCPPGLTWDRSATGCWPAVRRSGWRHTWN